LKAVVLAAGYGKRLKPLTINRPKHVLPLAGKPLVRWVIEALKMAGVDEVGVLVGYRSEMVVQALKGISSIEFINQREISGTGAALMECRKYLRGERTFVVVYGDVTLTSWVVKELIELHAGGLDGVLGAVEADGQGLYGVVEFENGLLKRIGEKELLHGPVNAGVYVLGEEVFDVLAEVKPSIRGEVELTDALNMLAARGRRIGVKVFEGGWWYDVGRPSDYYSANMTYLRQSFGDSVFISDGVVIGKSVSFEGPCFVGSGVVLGDGCIVEGPAMICDGAVVHEGSRVTRSIILENALLGPKSVVTDSIICENSRFLYGLEVTSSGSPAYVSTPDSLFDERLRV